MIARHCRPSQKAKSTAEALRNTKENGQNRRRCQNWKFEKTKTLPQINTDGTDFIYLEKTNCGVPKSEAVRYESDIFFHVFHHGVKGIFFQKDIGHADAVFLG